jgi:glycosyltransferase involved in cell wall biosynthesis
MSRAAYLATPGGVRGQGGMGRMTLYLARTWGERCPDLPLRVVDTYGPGSKLLMPVWFAAACSRVAAAGLLGWIAVLHVNVSERGSFLRKGLLVVLAQVLRVPVVLHCHGADLVEDVRGASPWRRRLIQAVFDGSACVLVLGGYWQDFVVGELGLPAGKVRVLWNAVPDPGRPALPADGTTANILFLGRLGERKGVPELLAALADPRLQALPWRATLAGDGPVEQYRALADGLGLNGRVAFTGWIGEQEAKERLAAADLLVLPSRHEGLPIAILEAMSHGLPVVATPVGAVSDAVRDGRTGLLVPPGDADALVRALERLVGSPSLRRTLGAAARARFVADFSLEAHVDQLRLAYGLPAVPQPLPRAA